jgi:hypothetical protein
MLGRIRSPVAILAGVASNPQNSRRAQAPYETRRLRVFAGEEMRIPQLRGFVAEPGEIVADLVPRRSGRSVRRTEGSGSVSAKLRGRCKAAADTAAERRRKIRRFIAVNSTTRCVLGANGNARVPANTKDTKTTKDFDRRCVPRVPRCPWWLRSCAMATKSARLRL